MVGIIVVFIYLVTVGKPVNVFIPKLFAVHVVPHFECNSFQVFRCGGNYLEVKVKKLANKRRLMPHTSLQVGVQVKGREALIR
jgi:hypothetical protein